MEVNWILLWICGVSTAFNLLLSFQNRRSPSWGWRAILAGLLLLLGLFWSLTPHIAGFLIAPVWFLLVMLPGVLLRRQNRLMAEHKYRRAYWLARIASILHPCDGWPQQAQLVRAMALFGQGKTERASAIVGRLGRTDMALGKTARLIQAQQTGGWQELLNWIDTHFSMSTILRDEPLLIARLQALGELGRPAEMLKTLGDALDGSVPLTPMGCSILQMRVAALSGLSAETQQQLTLLEHSYAEDVQEFWRLTARQVAGETGIEEQFRQLQKTASSYVQPMIARRLSHPLPRFDLSAAAPDVVDISRTLAWRIGNRVHLATWHGEDRRPPWATRGIALVLAACFVREMAGSQAVPAFSWSYLLSLVRQTTSVENLFGLGALIVPQSATPGEWWRVVTAGFLHFGPIHLGLNLLGLFALAPRLERAWGRFPMIVCYVVATLTSMALAPQVMTVPPGEIRVLVGASGGMMGLLGGLVGLLFIHWIRHRSEETRKPLLFLLAIIALQTTFDLSTPNVSFACHILGLATGIVFGVGWSWLRRSDAAPARFHH